MGASNITTRVAGIIQADNYKIPGTLSDDDASLVKEAILLPILLTLLERERRELSSGRGSLRFGKLYASVVERVMDMVTCDNTAIRRTLRQREIRIHRLGSDQEGVRYMYLHRGYERTMALSWNYIKAQLDVRSIEYIKGLMDQRDGSSKGKDR